MSRLICGRCGNVAAHNSTYCPHCRWVLYSDAPEGSADGAGIEEVEIPKGVGGFFERRRKEASRNQIEKQMRTAIDTRVEALERRIEAEPDSFEGHRALGLLSLLEANWERANAHLSRAHRLNPQDCQTHINWAIVLAQRGQVQPALDLLNAARAQWAISPFVLFNQAVIGLQARRYDLVLDCVAQLEKLWLDNPGIAQSYHDEAMTLRGLALFYSGQPLEARKALEAAASHIVAAKPAAVSHAAPEEAHAEATPDLIEVQANRTDEDAVDPAPDQQDSGQHLEGKMAEADTLCNLAIVEAALGETNRAVHRLAAALRMQPGHSRVLNNLGVLAYQQGRYAHAVYYLEMAQHVEEFLNHHEPAINNHLGVALSASGQMEKGMEHMQAAGGHERAEFEVFYNLGRAYVERGTPDRGVEFLKHAFQVNPNSAEVHIVLAAAYLLKGRTQFYAEARRHLVRAIQLAPKERVAYSDLALLCLETDDREGAIKIIRQTLKMDPQCSEALFMLGLLTMEGGNEQAFAQAATFFESALKTRPDLAASLFNSALCQYLMGFRDPASKLLERVTAHDPSIAPAYFLIGMGHAIGNRFQEALWAWQTALQFEPENVDLHANTGFISYQRGDFPGAIKHYLKAHQLAPGDPHVLGALGLSYAQDKKIHKAVEAFQRSLAISAANPVTHSNLGLALYLNKQVEQAMEEWRLVSQLDKGYAERRQEEQQKSYDDSLVSLRPVNWRVRVIRMAPVLPQPQMRMLAGYNARSFRPAIADPALLEAQKLRVELERADRGLAWMSAKH